MPQFLLADQCQHSELKRRVRYLDNRPRLLWHFDFEDIDGELEVQVDTDFAGCERTRRSTSGGVARLGAHLIKAWSHTQSVVAMSSAEAELTGICRSATIALGLQSLCLDLAQPTHLKIASDSTAAIGICRRRLGRVRHLAVADLWIQEGPREIF